MFEWLSQEIREVATNKYFVTDGPATADFREAVLGEEVGLPSSYKEFVLLFGGAKLYRQRSGYGLGVKAAPMSAVSPGGDDLLCIGHYLDRPAYFKVSTLGEGPEAPVFESGAGGLVRAADGFELWLRSRASAIRKALGKRRWASIVKGPAPFSLEEQAIVEARNFFDWRVVGVAENGDTLIDVTNNSDRVLPFLSIGVRSAKGDFGGKIWLPISEIAPSETKRCQKDCYKRHVSAGDLELFSLPDPGPEDRDGYWEFRH